MTSPMKVAPWPEQVVIGSVVAQLGKRAISMDPQDAADCDDVSLTRANTIIGTMESTVEWTQGPVASVSPRTPVSSSAAEDAVRQGALVFLRRGNNYRLYTPDVPAPMSAALLGSNASTVGAESEAAAAAPEAETDDGRGRSRKQYSKAVAFEFVNGVLGNILGGEEEVEAAWATA